MPLKLHRPLVFFDLETTGIDTSKDRIVELSFIKIMPDGTQEIKTRRLNPTIPIPKEASDVHGITDDMVTDCNTFVQVAKSLAKWLEGCDLAGFNSNRFDIPVLLEEFHRAGIKLDVDTIKTIDVQSIYHKLEPRTLSAAYKFYCNQSLENAHSAEADIKATYEILLAQIEKYPEIEGNVDFLSEFSKMNKNVDFEGRVVLDQNDVPVFNFGKHKGRPVTEVLTSEPSYYNWIMRGDFSQNTKDTITKIRLQMIAKPSI